jgi:sec-independent protein translocase protein TatC
MGLITPRFMIRNFKYAVMIIVLIAAVLSPDPGGMGMFMMAAPVVVLYILSIGLAWMFGKKKESISEEA